MNGAGLELGKPVVESVAWEEPRLGLVVCLFYRFQFEYWIL